MMKQYLSKKQISRQMGVAETTIDKWIKQGMISDDDRKTVNRFTGKDMPGGFEKGKSKYLYKTSSIARIINETGYEPKDILDVNNKLFRLISGYDHVYAVSADGEVGNAASLERYKPIKKNGYLSVDFYRDGQKHHYKVHQIVMRFFCENGRGCNEGHHIDGDKTNNSAENILPCFSGEHKVLHRLFNRLNDLPKGGKIYQAFYKEYMDEVERIRRLNRGHKICISDKLAVSVSDAGYKMYEDGTPVEKIPSDEILVEWFGKPEYNIPKKL